MQTLAAYLIFLLVVVAVGLATILGAILTLASYEGIAWMKSRPEFRLWGRSLLEASAHARAYIENEFSILSRAIRTQLTQPSHLFKAISCFTSLAFTLHFVPNVISRKQRNESPARN